MARLLRLFRIFGNLEVLTFKINVLVLEKQDSTVASPLAPCNYNCTEQIKFDHH